MKEINNGRRKLLGMLVAGAVLPAYGGTSDMRLDQNTDQKQLLIKPVKLFNIHTKERLVIEVGKESLSDNAVQLEINHFFRDHRQNADYSMDLKLIDQLHKLQNSVGNHREFEVIGGYRTKATNDMLRSKSRGVAKFSYHCEGRAVDVRLPGTDSYRLMEAAIAMHAGGVGYYRQSNFIHLDTGEVRNWAQR